MSSIFDSSNASPSSEAELAQMAKDNPELAAETPAETPAAETPAETQTPAATEIAETPATETAPADADKAPPKTVPVSVLIKERERANQLETQLAEFRGRLDQFQQFLPQAPKPQTQQQEEPPDPDTDPIGALRYQTERSNRLEAFLQQQAVETRVAQDYAADSRRFAAANPDFGAAYDYLLNSRVAELRAQGYQDAQIMPHVQREEMQIAHAALRAGKSPAQAMYDLAVARSYKKAAPPPAATKTTPDPALQKAREIAATSIADGGKPEKGGSLTLDDIVNNLHGAAQEAALKKYERENSRKSVFRE